MIEILPDLGKYKYDTWRILLVKCYIDNSVRLQSYIRNINSDQGDDVLWKMIPNTTGSNPLRQVHGGGFVWQNGRGMEEKRKYGWSGIYVRMCASI
jgi:hypothetical protein